MMTLAATTDIFMKCWKFSHHQFVIMLLIHCWFSCLNKFCFSVCKDDIAVLDSENKNFDITPSSAREALMSDTMSEVSFSSDDNIIVSFNRNLNGKARFLEVSLWAGNAGHVTLSLYSNIVFKEDNDPAAVSDLTCLPIQFNKWLENDLELC